MKRWLKKVIIPFLAPALLFYLLFFIYPAIQALWVSLHKWSGFTPKMEFIGLANFREALYDPFFHKVILQTLGLLFFGGILTFAISLILTGIVASVKKGRNFFRIVIFTPNVVAMVALSTIWSFIYNPGFGLINSFFSAVGLKRLSEITWMGPDLVYWSVLFAVVWIYVGFYTIIFIAGAEKIPLDYYEAAVLEGASKAKMFFTITIPLMWDVISVGVVLWIIDAFMQFEFYYAISGAFPPVKIWTIPIYVFVLAFGKRTPIYRMGYGTALSVFLLFFIAIFVAVGRKILKREVVQY